MNNKTIAKQTVKLMDHVPGKKIKKGNSIFVNPCPICGHKEHFVIDEAKNIYCSYSKCCNGGSIIDWFVEFEKLTLQQSINKCLSFAGLEDDDMISRDIIIFTEKKNNEKKIEAEKNKILDLFKIGKINLVETIIYLIPFYRCYNEKKTSNIKEVVRKCYHKLTTFERVLRQIENKDVFLHWLLGFIDRFTSLIVKAPNEEQIYKLCLDFKSELHYSYNEFLKYENDLIELVGKTDELKLLSGGINNV